MFIAIALSVLDHLRQEYHPKDIVLTAPGGRWRAETASPGIESEPGLIVYRFEAPLFFANADYFAARVRDVVTSAPHPVRWLVLDLASMSDIDYTGGLTLAMTIKQLQEKGITVALSAVEDVAPELDRLDVSARVGRERMFESVQDAVDAFAGAGRTGS